MKTCDDANSVSMIPK